MWLLAAGHRPLPVRRVGDARWAVGNGLSRAHPYAGDHADPEHRAGTAGLPRAEQAFLVSRAFPGRRHDGGRYQGVSRDPAEKEGTVKVTGYRSLTTQHDWGRLIGDANGVMPRSRTEVHVLILETDSGLEGVGVGPHGDIDRVFGAIEGQDPRGVSALYDRMLDQVFKSGHAGATFGAIGAIDMALWDLKAKAAGEPLWRTLGALDRFVPGYASGLDIALDDETLVELYEEFADRGFTAGKLKGGRNLEHDLRRLQAVRDVLGRNSAHPALMLDANESWNRSQAVRFVTGLERTVDLTWVEEPVRRWDAAGLASV